MSALSNIKDKIKKFFPSDQTSVLFEVVDIVNETVKVKDFNELKEIVRELAQAQKEFAEAQKRTEQEFATLTRGLTQLRKEIGGPSQKMSYAFENESFRMLPRFLKEKYRIEVKEKLVRAEIGGK